MTEIEKKALALVNECAARLGITALYEAYPHELANALCRAIRQHEAFRQEVSEAVQDYIDHYRQEGWLGFDHFIIAKPDPLVEAWDEAHKVSDGVSKLETFRAALAARGLKIVEDK